MFGYFSKEAYNRTLALLRVAEALREDAERKLEEARREAERHQATAAKMIDQAVDYATQLSKDLAQEKAENKLLIDRIVQLAGQPALFDKTPAPPPPQPAPASTLPGPRARAGFDDVHREARQALKDGTFSLKGRSN